MQGMTLIQYVGRNKGSSQWGGPGGSPTGQKYIFGDNARDKIKYVKADDVAWILGLRDGGKPLFQVHNPKSVEPEPELPTEPTDDDTGEQSSDDASDPDARDSGGSDLDGEAGKTPDISGDKPAVTDPAALTIAEIKALDLNEAGWLTLYEAEQAGKNRAGALEFISSKLPQLEDDAI